MSKIIRLTHQRCDNEHIITFKSKTRFASLCFKSIYDAPEESIEEILDFFTADMVFNNSSDPDDLVVEEGGRFTKKGIKELHQVINELRDELLNDKPHHVTDEISDSNSHIPSHDHVVDKN